MARTFGPAVSEEYSPVVFTGGGGVADAYPLVVVESDTAQVSVLQSFKSDPAGVSVLPVAGCKFPAVFLGKVALDVVGLGVGPPCLRVDSEETLLTLTDKRAPSARAAPGVTLVDSSEMGAPVRELIWSSVLEEPLVVYLQEPMPGMNSLEYVIQATTSVWMPFKQVHNVVSGDVDFDFFGIAPWDAGGMHGDRYQLHKAMQTMMLQRLMRLLCQPVIVHGLDRIMTMNTEYGLDTIIMITTDSPRLTVTPGECYASDGTTQIRRDLRHAHDISAAVDCKAVELNDLIFRWLRLLPENV